VLTAGVDLAAEPRGTALAVIDWSGDSARVVELELGVGDDRIADVAPTVASLGIDCAFGWPDDFVSFITRHSAASPCSASPRRVADRASSGDDDWRTVRPIALRASAPGAGR
jgi:hypothetical protein